MFILSPKRSEVNTFCEIFLDISQLDVQQISLIIRILRMNFIIRFPQGLFILSPKRSEVNTFCEIFLDISQLDVQQISLIIRILRMNFIIRFLFSFKIFAMGIGDLCDRPFP